MPSTGIDPEQVEWLNEAIAELEEEGRLDSARSNLLDFISHVWWYPEPFLVGRHTKAICDRLSKAVEDFEQGISTYLLVQVPFRHGKSDIISRAFPPYFQGRCKSYHPNMIMTAYGAGLSEGFSKDCKRIIRSDEYRQIPPDVDIARGSDNIAECAIDGSTGRLNFVGLGGSAVGKGAHVLVVDDYCKSRAEARSKTLRDKVWDAFRVDLMSRLAPTHIVAITATPWHVDDMAGRLQELMANEKNFPKFEVIRFAAGGAEGPHLFPELYSAEWYAMQYASQGHLAAANLDCNPVVEGGNRFAVDQIVIHDNDDDFPPGRYVRAWDLASSAKQRSGDDPDWTVGALGIAKRMPTGDEFWIKDVTMCREEAPKRDALIMATTERDGPSVTVGVEGFGAYKDAYTTLANTLRGKRTVRKLNPPGDKEVKASVIEAPMEAGRVHILRAAWNDMFIRHFAEFPDGSHDDIVDSIALIWHMTAKPQSGIARIR